MQVPRSVVRFNQRINNPIQSQYAWLLPPWSVVVHRGRRSGRVYRTPVNAFRRRRRVAMVILYGEGSDWVRNVLAGDGRLVRGGRTYALRDPRVVSVAEAGDTLPRAARTLGRISGKVLVAELDGPAGGFGRGPRAA